MLRMHWFVTTKAVAQPVFFTSDESSFITGTALGIDRGSDFY
jgi:hypothetical protein